jgi:hypothetical protein
MDMAKVISRRVVEMGRSFGPGSEVRHELRRSVQVRSWCFRPMDGIGLARSPGLRRANHLRNLLQLLPEMSAIIHERDALEVENDRLHAILGLS